MIDFKLIWGFALGRTKYEIKGEDQIKRYSSTFEKNKLDEKEKTKRKNKITEEKKFKQYY